MTIENIEIIQIYRGFVIALRLTGFTLWWTGPKLDNEKQKLTHDNWSTSSGSALCTQHKDIALIWKEDIIQRRSNA
jgi:hypothetical protein